MPSPSFDRLARIYRALEFIAFGHDLERARFCFLERLAGCRNILVLGEGDGRCLARLVAAAPHARIHCIDSSPAMIAQASARLARAGARDRVTFECADVLSVRFSAGRYDAVTTLFFLDCFLPAQVAAIVNRARASLRPGGLWLFADFVLPPRGWSRLRARISLAVLYAFFRWQTGLPASSLPDSEAILAAAGFRREAVRDFQWGFVRSAIYADLAGKDYSLGSSRTAGFDPPT